MSDFYIFLEEKGFSKTQIENFSDSELSELYKEFQLELIKESKE